MITDICVEPPATQVYDTVFCYNAFPHFRDKEAALQNICRALKSQGTLIILHFLGRQALNEMHRKVGDAVQNDQLPTSEELNEMLKKAGFEVSFIKDEPTLYFAKAHKK